uniref:Uncharacterized protein n=1 Tax=Strongyloides stercoralis TaxID=6248 RepID=A0A0K0ES40_STRER
FYLMEIYIKIIKYFYYIINVKKVIRFLIVNIFLSKN